MIFFKDKEVICGVCPIVRPTHLKNTIQFSLIKTPSEPHLKHHMIAIYRCHVPCFSYDAGSTWCLEKGP